MNSNEIRLELIRLIQGFPERDLTSLFSLLKRIARKAQEDKKVDFNLDQELKLIMDEDDELLHLLAK